MTNLRQENINVTEYALRFIEISKYASSIMVDRRTKINKFVSSVPYLVLNNCNTSVLIHDINISCMWSIPIKFRKKRLRKNLVRQRRKEQTMVTSNILDFVDEVVQGMEKGSLGKVVQMRFHVLKIKGCVTLNLK